MGSVSNAAILHNTCYNGSFGFCGSAFLWGCPYNATLCNLAWGGFFGRVFLFVGLGSSLIFLFTASFYFQLKKKKQCAACGVDKKHDGKNYRRVGVGETNKRQREFCKNGWVLFAVGSVGLWVLS